MEQISFFASSNDRSHIHINHRYFLIQSGVSTSLFFFQRLCSCYYPCFFCSPRIQLTFLLTQCRTSSFSYSSRSYLFLVTSSYIPTPRLFASSSSICRIFLLSYTSVFLRIHSSFYTLSLMSCTVISAGWNLLTFLLGDVSPIFYVIYAHLLAYFLSTRIKDSPSLEALAVRPARCTQVSPLVGTPICTTWVIWKSSPLAATSVAIRILQRVDFLNFYSFFSLCFCCMWECRLTTCIPKASTKY